MNTANLLQRCQSGDEVAIQTLIEEYYRPLFRLACSVMLDADEAEEAIQDAFLIALKALDSFKGESLRPWLYSITLNECRMRLRRRKALERLKDRLISWFWVTSAGPTQPEGVVIENEADAALWKAVNDLGEKHRLPVVLYYYHNFSVTEIARMLDLSEGTIHSRLFTARERLRRVLYRQIDPFEPPVNPVERSPEGEYDA